MVNIAAKIEYKDFDGLGYYDSDNNKIVLNKKLQERPEDQEIILRHELKHFNAGGNFLKQLWIDFTSMFDRRLQKVIRNNYTPKDRLRALLPIFKEGGRYFLNTSVIVFYCLFIIIAQLIALLVG